MNTSEQLKASKITPAQHKQIADLDQILPQTQCQQCGYAGCLPYAQAMVLDNAPINRCPPGGESGLARLAQYLQIEPIALDATCGTQRPRLWVAQIDETQCIGCTLCIQACPVDAIVGAPRRMHTVVTAECTGCDLCLPPCPVDCIQMQPREPLHVWTSEDASAARARLQLRQERARQARLDNDERLEGQALYKLASLDAATSTPSDLELNPSHKTVAQQRQILEQALARVRARRSQSPADNTP